MNSTQPSSSIAKPSSLVVRCIQTTQEFETLRPAWQDILNHSGADSAFLTWEWLYTWWKTKGEILGKRLRLITAWDGTCLAGIAPLMLEYQRHYGLRLPVLRSLGGEDIDIGGFIARQNDPQTIWALCRALVHQIKGWNAVLLNQFPQEDPITQTILEAFQALGLIIRVKTEDHLYLPLDGDNWDSYLRRLSGVQRRNWKRARQGVEKAGGYTYTSYIGPEIKQEHLSILFSINENGNYPELYRAPQEKAFQRALLDTIAPLGWPHLSLLSIQEQPVSFIYSLVYRGKYEGWRAGFDQNYAKLSVGKLAMIHLIEECYRRQYREIDFLRGDESYKNHFRLQKRPYYWQIWATPRWKLIPLLLTIGIPRLKERVKSWVREQEKTPNALPPVNEGQDTLAS